MAHTPTAPGLTPEAALKEAVRLAGSQGKLADLCGCTQGAISQMLSKPEPRLSHKYVLTVSAGLGIAREALRPDLYPPADADTPAEARAA